MELLVLNEDFETVYVLDKFESIIWTDRYSSYGDFEIYTSADKDIIKNLKIDYYIWSSHSEHLMIIEDVTIETDVENGNHCIITGRSIESLLDRRIIWRTTDINGDFYLRLYWLLYENAINPSDQKRVIPNLKYKDPEDPDLKFIQIHAQFTGDTLYDAIKKMCDSVNLGFKITLNDQNQFVFALYSGVDRSYDQYEKPYIVFSPNFDNVINSNYYESKRSFKNAMLIAGEGEGYNRTTIEVNYPGSEGLSRRELYVDARDVTSTAPDGSQMPDDEYFELLTQRGDEELTEHKIIKTFDGQVETSQMYKYGEDFYMGDIVQLENEYGMKSKARIVEFIHSENANGIEEYPTFEIV